MESIWSKTIVMPERKPLHGYRRAEVAVIGAGMAGLLTAYFLQKQGKEVIVLEAGRIASGQTKNTTAKITSQHGCIYADLIQNYGEERARLYARANEEAVARYRAVVQEERLDCHFEEVCSYLYSMKDVGMLRREQQAAERLGIKASLVMQTGLPFPVKGAVRFENQAQFHPLEFLKGISEGLEVYEHTRALRVRGHSIKTSHGRVYAEQIVFAAHYPFLVVPGFYFARMHQERSYVVAVKNVPKFEGMYYSADDGGLSFRWYEDMLLIGGAGHRVGKMKAGSGYSALKNKVELLYPDHKKAAMWSAQDCVTHDMLPLIGRYSCFCPHWYVVSGLKKWGMTGAMVSAGLVCDMICKKRNPYRALFTPQRCCLSVAWRKMLQDYKISGAGLAKGYLHLPLFSGKAPAIGQARIVRRGLKRVGMYCDETGEFHKTPVKCTHMGCELAWNPQEKTWDCPCHGSRFDYDGKLIDDPAQNTL